MPARYASRPKLWTRSKRSGSRQKRRVTRATLRTLLERVHSPTCPNGSQAPRVAEPGGKLPLPGRIGEDDGEAGEHVGEDLVRQREPVVDAEAGLHGQPDVMARARLDHRIGRRGSVMKDPEPGRRLVGERPQALQIARHGPPAEVELARDAGKSGRAHGMLEPATRADGLAEPVEPEAVARARLEGGRARR